ncbi:MAG: hypothetical protein EOP49_11120, partial [Sphingobacteriales bacterium]
MPVDATRFLENGASGTRKLMMFLLLIVSAVVSAQEICNNGIDDDNDGKIDLNDVDCLCGMQSIPSIIPNPSFETFTECPSSFSQLYSATPWVQATDATTDYFNTCGYMLPAIVGTPLTTLPDGNGYVGALFLTDWNEYLGTFLQTPLVQGTTYQLTFNIAATRLYGNGTLAGNGDVSIYETVDITLYGFGGNANLPISTQYNPTLNDPNWYELGHASYTPLGEWGEITLVFTPPQNTSSIMLGAPQVLPPSYPSNSGSEYPYFIYDNLRLNEASVFGVNIAQTGNFCENNLILTANLTTTFGPDATYQWYLDGIAISGATSPTLNVNSIPANLGVYGVRVADGTNCFVSLRNIDDNLPSPAYTATEPTCIVPTAAVTITTPAAQYSFDNGATWQTSNVANLPIGVHFIKIKSATGCISAGAGVNVVEPNLLPASGATVDQPQSCGDTGTISVNSTIAAEYSFDDGVTWTTNPVAANLAPGSYNIRIKDDSGCMSGAQYITIYEFFEGYPEFTAVQPTCDAPGSITVTSDADEYSFDGGVTWTTNPVAANLPAGSYVVVTRSGGTCISYFTYVYLYEFFLDYPLYSTVAPTCGTGGSITITTTANEYSFDGGTTWTTSNTATGLTAGSYPILIRNGLGCVSYPNWIYLYEEYFVMPPFSITDPFCTETTGLITIDPIAGFEYSFDGGATYQVSNVSPALAPGSYQLMVRDGLGCTSQMAYAYISDPTGIPSAPSGNAVQLFCLHNSPTVSDLIASGENISWYFGTNPTPLTPATPLQNGVYFASQTGSNGCEGPVMLEVAVSVVSYSIPVTNHVTAVCDQGNNGSETVNLTDYNAFLIANDTSYTFSYFSSFSGADANLPADAITNASSFNLSASTVIYARIVAANGCWGVAQLTLNPVFEPVNAMPSEYILCENSHVTLTADPGFDGYLWSTGETTQSITVTQDGTYDVMVSENHGNIVCTTTRSIEVNLSNPATLISVDTSDWTINDNSITINVEGLGDYEYSLDGLVYQDSPVFEGVYQG